MLGHRIVRDQRNLLGNVIQPNDLVVSIDRLIAIPLTPRCDQVFNDNVFVRQRSLVLACALSTFIPNSFLHPSNLLRRSSKKSAIWLVTRRPFACCRTVLWRGRKLFLSRRPEQLEHYCLCCRRSRRSNATKKNAKKPNLIVKSLSIQGRVVGSPMLKRGGRNLLLVNHPWTSSR